MRVPLNTDIAAGVLGLVIAAVFWLPQPELGRLSIGFPRAVLVVMVVLSIALVIRGFVRPSSREIHIEGNPIRLLVMIGILLLWWVGISTVGYVVTTLVLFTTITVYLARVQRPVTARDLAIWIAIIVAVVGSFYLVFIYVLGVRPFGGWII